MNLFFGYSMVLHIQMPLSLGICFSQLLIHHIHISVFAEVKSQQCGFSWAIGSLEQSRTWLIPCYRTSFIFACYLLVQVVWTLPYCGNIWCLMDDAIGKIKVIPDYFQPSTSEDSSPPDKPSVESPSRTENCLRYILLNQNRKRIWKKEKVVICLVEFQPSYSDLA